MHTSSLLTGLVTPALLLDAEKMQRNMQRLDDHTRALGVTLRPHVKTAKSVEVIRHLFKGGTGPITVSTLAEAEVFFGAGYTDILYCVGVAPGKLERIISLRQKGCDLAVILDSVAQAQAVAEAGIPALIEIDSDGHRSGLAPDDPVLVEIGRILHHGGVLRGVVTHAGESYTVSGLDAHAAFAEAERAAAVRAAETLRAAGLSCPVVSVGSTPTAHAARDLTGVNELRAGVYMFFDLVMAGIGVCTIDDIAISVLTSVIGHQTKRGWIMVDAGWMAMSRDRGTASQAVDQGYGVVCDIEGRPYPDLVLTACNQEHGIISRRPGTSGQLPDLPVGTLLRILPNHACATAAQHGRYQVVSPGGGALQVWDRFGGW
ncbi:MAG: alanine racemase [Tabrizicola sp.]|jgi:D-serine deaminase-like pyridoxal phosphate-dependent protein|nr:alanine racemase [Tabrizicola sp.]